MMQMLEGSLQLPSCFPADRLNIAVWGLGGHAFKNILPAFRATGDVRLAGVHSRNAESMKRACLENECRSWDREDSMLGDDSVDAIYLATPVGLHHEQGMRILNSGKHLICEKSLTHDLESAQELIQRARESGLILCETFMYLYHPQFGLLAQRLREQPRRILSLSCSFVIPKLENPGYRYDPKLGGGALLDTGCYPLSMVLALLPGPAIPKVHYAFAERSPGFSVDTSGVSLLQTNDGTHAFLSWGYGFSYKNHMSILTETENIDVDFVFSKRPDLRTFIRVQNSTGNVSTIEVDPANSFVEMFSHIKAATRDPLLRERLLRQAERQAELLGTVRDFQLSLKNR